MKEYVVCYYVTDTDDERIYNTQKFVYVSADTPQQVADIFQRSYKEEISVIAEVVDGWTQKRMSYIEFNEEGVFIRKSTNLKELKDDVWEFGGCVVNQYGTFVTGSEWVYENLRRQKT